MANTLNKPVLKMTGSRSYILLKAILFLFFSWVAEIIDITYAVLDILYFFIFCGTISFLFSFLFFFNIHLPQGSPITWSHLWTITLMFLDFEKSNQCWQKNIYTKHLLGNLQNKLVFLVYFRMVCTQSRSWNICLMFRQ